MEFPGGSKSRVNRAGANIRLNTASTEDLVAVEQWRSAHRGVLNTFQSILRSRTRNLPIIVAQRHKRQRTIFGKLDRYPKMLLARMDDVAGCRLIFKSMEELYDFRALFHNARFKHQRKNDRDKYDYIKNPKRTGYRGVHDVYSYDVNSDVGKPLKGLLVEIQYRTLVQHAWATANEVIGFITESQPKFEEGDKRYLDTMAFASEILARVYENRSGPLPDISNKILVKKFRLIDRKLKLLKTLRGLNTADSEVSANRNVILIFSPSAELEVRTYRDATEALPALFILEREFVDRDVVLVKADTSDDVRIAFRNYFSDAQDFIGMVDDACKQLS